MQQALASVLLGLAATLSAQTPIEIHEEERTATRLLFRMDVEQPAEVAVHYQPTDWREEFQQLAEQPQAQRFRLSTGFWTSLHSNVDLMLGGKKIPAGIWYLGLRRAEGGAWHLSLYENNKIRQRRAISGETRILKPDLEVHFDLEKEERVQDRLQIRLCAGEDKPQQGSLQMSWGPYRAKLPMAVGIRPGPPAGEPAFAALDGASVQTTRSGLRFEELRAGAGPRPSLESKVKVRYVGWLQDGKKFDSSFARRLPAEFPLKLLIKGWQEGLALMNKGAVYRFEIPSHLGYGKKGAGTLIPPDSKLVFWVELVSFE